MSTSAEAAAQLIYPANVQANSSLTDVKFISSCFAGAAAGILGLENWLGFALFLVSTLFTSACIYGINCHGKPGKYVHGGVWDMVNPGQDNAFTFVLVWTLFYGELNHERCFCERKN
jgi:ER membrane protein complex subunit 6